MNELKQLVLEKMDKSGVLGQLKAQMRAKVFNIIDSQERQKDKVSALYVNNHKIQSAKTDENALKALELFADFLEFYQLGNTKEIFLAETNYQKHSDTERSLRAQFPEQAKSLGEQLVARALKGPQVVREEREEKKERKGPREEQPPRVDYKSQMDDLRKKSEQLDQLIQRRKQEKKSVESEEEPGENPLGQSKDSLQPEFENPALKSLIAERQKQAQTQKGRKSGKGPAEGRGDPTEGGEVAETKNAKKSGGDKKENSREE